MHDDEGFEAFVTARWGPLVATAYLVTATGASPRTACRKP